MEQITGLRKKNAWNSLQKLVSAENQFFISQFAKAEYSQYQAPKDSRPFNFERYELSKHLPKIIDALGEKETLVCHAGYGSFAAVKILDTSGNEIDYFVSFVVFKEKKKLRLHVQSAYPLDQKLGNVKKVGFFAIAKNLLLGKKLPKPWHNKGS